jgi:prepilin-type N-terminal cleavage/methylation domain-containing protein
MSATGDAGFTLLEMLVVLAITALIAGIGFPRMQGQIAAQEWRTGVASVAALLRTARAQALRSGAVTTVSVAPDGHRLHLGDAEPVVLPASVVVKSPRPLAFFGDGSSRGGEIAVRGAGRSVRIRVAPATGLLTQVAPATGLSTPRAA